MDLEALGRVAAGPVPELYGATLTDAEKQTALGGSAVLCATCAAEQAPAAENADADADAETAS